MKSKLFFALALLALSLFSSIVTNAQYSLDGPGLVIPGSTHGYSLNTGDTLLPQQPGYSQFWLEGAGSIQQRSRTYADITFSQYFTGGRVCFGMNFGVAPYYIQVCKQVNIADFTISVNPNPSPGEFNFYYNSSTLPVYDLTVTRVSTGEVKFTMSQVSHPTVVFGRYYDPGLYTVTVTASGLTKTLTIVKQ
jgi:hypothetical protein